MLYFKVIHQMNGCTARCAIVIRCNTHTCTINLCIINPGVLQWPVGLVSFVGLSIPLVVQEVDDRLWLFMAEFGSEHAQLNYQRWITYNPCGS